MSEGINQLVTTLFIEQPQALPGLLNKNVIVNFNISLT